MNPEQKHHYISRALKELERCDTFILLTYNEGSTNNIVTPLTIEEAMGFMAAVFDKLNTRKVNEKSIDDLE